MLLLHIGNSITEVIVRNVIRCFLATALFMMLPVTASAEPPEVSTARSAELRVLKRMERIVVESLEMVVFRDDDSGESCTVRFETQDVWKPKLRVTYRF